MAELNPTAYKALGDLLERRMRELGKTFRYFHWRLRRFHVMTLKGWYNGDKLPSRDNLPRLAKVYQVDLAVMTAAYLEAKEARRAETQVLREVFRKSRRTTDPLACYGGGGGRHALGSHAPYARARS